MGDRNISEMIIFPVHRSPPRLFCQVDNASPTFCFETVATGSAFFHSKRIYVALAVLRLPSHRSVRALARAHGGSLGQKRGAWDGRQ